MINTKTIFSFLVMIASLLFWTSCKDEPVSIPPTKGYDYHKYACGHIGKIAYYWHDDTAFRVGTSALGSDALDLFVMGRDVYLAGYEVNALSKNVAKYWRNGEAFTLGDGLHNSKANALTINNSELYVVGHSNNKAVLWRSGNIEVLGPENSTAVDVMVVGSDVYVLGNTYELNPVKGNIIHRACYWKNGELVYFGDNQTYLRAYAFDMLNDQVIAVGDLGYSAIAKPVFMFEGEYRVMEEYANSTARTIKVIDNNPIIGGKYLGRACYWKNSQRFFLKPYIYGQVNGLDVYKDTVFSGGILENGVVKKATYWNDRFPTVLQSSEGDSSVVHQVIIKD